MLPKANKTLTDLPPYVFVRLNALAEKARAAGKDILDLGQGNPDLPTPENIVDAVCRAVRDDPSTHRYPQTKGSPQLRRAIAAWYKRRFDVDLDPETEVLPLVG